MEGSEPDVRPAGRAGRRRAAGRELRPDTVARSAVRQSLLERSRTARLDPLGQLDEEAGRRPLEWVRVERDVVAGGAGVVDEREHRLRASREGRAVIEVGDVGGRGGPPADLDGLAERIEIAVAERIP